MLFRILCTSVIVLSLFLLPEKGFGQMDSVASVIEQSGRKQASSSMFVHFDKNVYTNNDQVWFTGYLMNSIVEITDHRTLYLSMVYLTDSSVVMQQNFLIDNGFTFGGFTLPDSLLSGNYRFVAHTNVKYNGQPYVEFIQPITIKSVIVDPLTASIQLFEKRNERTGNGKVLIKAITGDQRFVPDALVTYSFGKTKTLKSGTARTNVIGEVMLEFAADQINWENNVVQVSLKKGKSVRYLRFELPVLEHETYDLKFYPEGGHLVEGVLINIGIELKDKGGNPVQGVAVLYENDVPGDTLSTGASGMGMFRLLAKSNVVYRVKLIHERGLNYFYTLPQAISRGISIRIDSAVVSRELKGYLESNRGEDIHLVVHNRAQILMHSEIRLRSGRPQKFVLKLDSLPVGLSAITILDASYRPLAERIFFAGYDKIPILNIQVETEQYKTRSPVQVGLNIKDHNGALIDGIVSVSVVQANRVLNANRSDIVDYTYLQRDLTSLPIMPSGNLLSDLSYLNNVLRIKGWRKFAWPSKQILLDDAASASSYVFSGLVSRKDKAPKAPLTMNIISNSQIFALQTDSLGRFIVEDQMLLMEENHKVLLNLGAKNYQSYAVKLNDPAEELKQHIHQMNFDLTSSQMKVLPQLEYSSVLNGIKLKEVTIRKEKDNDIRYMSGSGPNKCGDYVYRYHILNCQNHIADAGSSAPIEGRTYYDARMRTTIVYRGCAKNDVLPNMFLLKQINLPKEFYLSDLSNLNEPINFSTVYWNYQLPVKPQLDNSFSFNTGDLNGVFKIIIQGLSDQGPIYAEREIKIDRP